MTVGHRIHFGEVLRLAREQSMLVIAATDCALAERWPGRNAARLLAHERETLVRIDGALRALRADPCAFGVCEECGSDISIARLSVTPWARRCDAHGPATLLQ